MKNKEGAIKQYELSVQGRAGVIVESMKSMKLTSTIFPSLTGMTTAN
jgi:hypothetical protein